MAAKSIVVLHFGADGQIRREAVAGAAKPRRRGSRRYRGLEKLMRRVARATGESSRAYLDRHERSNHKKRNGWVKDLPKNLRKANRRGMKILKLRLY